MPLTRKARATRAGKTTDDPEDFRLTLIEHIEDLRDRIVKSLIVISVAWVAGWYMEPWAYNLINRQITPYIVKRMPKGTEFRVVFSHATEPFLLQLRLSFMIGAVIAFPIVAILLWGFIAPGLKKVERRVVQSVAPASLVLFVMGVAFCWWVLPSCFTWFVSYMDSFPGTSLYQDPGTLVYFVLKLLLAFGVGFQLPLVVFVLGKIGLLSPDMLLRNWRQATVAIFVISAIVTPSNDPLTMLMMALPLSVLFVMSVYAVRFTTKRKSLGSDDDLNNLD